MASTRKTGAGDRVLESRHVIGLFLLMLVFSAVFFTLGYVMGRNQYDGQVAAAGGAPRNAPAEVIPPKPDAAAKHSSKAPSAPAVAADPAPASSEWEMYNTAKPKESDEHLKPGAVSSSTAAPKNAPENVDNARPTVVSDNAKTPQASGSYTLQVTAVRRQSDAMDLARRLQKKKFPAFVLAPQGNKYYRVQVGPYSDLKSAEAARKGLEGAGFRAIVKRG
jgi:cell division septation protein DedD